MGRGIPYAEAWPSRKAKPQVRKGFKMSIQALIVASVAVLPQGQQETATYRPLFSEVEKAKIVAYWSEPGRYIVGPVPGTEESGPWAVRLPPEASQWFWDYNRARGLAKTPPSQTPPASNDEQKAWEAWIDAKVARDRWLAGKDAESRNTEETGKTAVLADTIEPPDPGPMPDGLAKLMRTPPTFAVCVQPRQHTIRFDEGLTLSYSDYVPMRMRYAYFRFPQGVMSGGTPVRNLPQEELDRLFKEAGITTFEQRVMKAVSMLEGGFDSINTYDTGYVSVGLIQFACLKDGIGSLGALLLRHKTENLEAFDTDFRQFGIDVSPLGELAAVDPVSGEELIGPAAAMKIIQEPRLAAVFQRAGRVSRGFRVAQIKTAKAQYYPDSDTVTVSINGQPATVKVGDFIKTEAGMATLMDRKVNTGKLDPLPAVLNKLIADLGIVKLEELADYEWDIVSLMKYRRDYLAETALTQPDRKQGRKGRNGGKVIGRSAGSL